MRFVSPLLKRILYPSLASTGCFRRRANRAQRSVRKGHDPWIFSASGNRSSVRGLESSGFQKCYSLVRQKTLMVQRVTKFPSLISPVAEVRSAPEPRGVS